MELETQSQGRGEGGQQAEGSAPRSPRSRRRPRYRSLFWAIIVIAAGVVWLLFNLDVLSAKHLGMLGYLWPILIIGFGVDLLVSRRSPGLGAFVGVVTAGVVVALMAVGPSLGWLGDTDLKRGSMAVQYDGATAASVRIDTGPYSAVVDALPSQSEHEHPLLMADVTYRGKIDLESSGDTEKTVTIGARGQRWWWQFLDLEDAEPWDISIAPDIALSLRVSSSSGSADLDLSGLRLRDLKLDMSSGDAEVALPAVDGEEYRAALRMSSGDMVVKAAPGARIDMTVDMSSGDAHVALGQDSDVTVTFNGSSGQFSLDLATGQAFRAEVRSVSSGDVDLPSGLTSVAEGDD